MNRPAIEFDLTPLQREEVQCVLADIELYPDKARAYAAELVLLRKVFDYVRRYRTRFPPLLQRVVLAAARRPELARISADTRDELQAQESS